MLIIHKYIIKNIIKYFLIVLSLVVGIYLIVDFFQRIDNFVKADFNFSKIIIYFIAKTPFIIAQVTPVGILLAILITFGIMKRNNETVALKSCGVSTACLLKPVFITGLLLSIILFFFSETVVPIYINKSNQIWSSRKGPATASRDNNVWIKGDRRITHIKYYNPEVNTAFGLTITFFDNNFNLLKKIDAQKGVFNQGEWILFNMLEQNFGAYKKDSVNFYEKKVEKLSFLPEDLKKVVKKSAEMSFKELYAYVKKVEAEGYDATIYRVDLWAKIAFPFVCLLMCLTGSGLSLKGKIREGLPVSIASGIGITFVYWIFYSFCLSLGYGEVLPPVIAAWTANFVFFCAGIIILIGAE